MIMFTHYSPGHLTKSQFSIFLDDPSHCPSPVALRVVILVNDLVVLPHVAEHCPASHGPQMQSSA